MESSDADLPGATSSVDPDDPYESVCLLNLIQALGMPKEKH